MDKAARAALMTAKRKDNASENIADYVADLLRQGRASEVTDDLMAQADPQRLHQHYTTGNTGMNLPMDYASRMERAKQMGFDTGNKLYHGTDRAFSAFDPKKFGEKDAGWYGRGVTTDTDPEVAEAYANYHEPEQGQNIIPTFSRGRHIDWPSANLPFGNPRESAQGTKDMQALGYSGSRMTNDRDLYGDTPDIGSEQVTFDPKDVRSQFARFDPRLEHLAHLSASTGGAMEFARHVEAVHRAGGQIAPSKYLPNVPRAVHAAGGRIHANGGGTMDLRSKAAQVIRNQPQEKGNVDQMLAMMAAKGVKPSELLNAGRPFGHSVSKEELAQHFENAVPKVQVQRNDGLRAGSSPTRYNNYTLPGGEKYREHLLHLGDIQEQKQKLKENLYERWEKAKASGDTETADQIVSKYYSLGNYDVDPNFQSNHWSIPNVIAHVRMKDRDNGKTLHVEEVQSDWGQKGREKGFYDPAKPVEVFHTGTGQTVHATDNLKEAKDKAEELGPEYDYAYQDEDKVPQGPYVGNTQHWTDLAVKHALTEAAKGGHDRVVFSPGEANADLYDQRRPITEADLVSDPNNSEILGHLHTYDSNSRKQNAPIKVRDEAHLAKLLGREHAKDILAEPLSNLSSTGMKSRFISGPNMNLGGHGMVDYYNNIVHPAALKLLRQHDPSIQPESYDLPNGYKGFSLPMTDKARQSILDNGFQAFKRGGAVDDDDEDGITAYHGSAYDFPQFDIGKLGTGTGHQAYGHGLYFAGDENDAKNYREMLKNNGSIDIEHESHKLGIPLDRDAQADLRSVSRNVNGDPAAAARALQARNLAARAMPQEKLADLIDKHRKSTSGHMYKVRLNVKPEELLDWNKPLSEQHPNVQAALSRTMPDYTIKNMAGIPHAFANGKMIEINPNGLTGRDAYVLSRMGKSTENSNSHQDAKAASEHLLSEGIKGIRYKEGGTHNYVMFHHDPVQVVEKYEYGGTVGKAGGGAMGEGSDIQIARVQELIDKHGGDEQAAKEYLRTSLPSIPASSQDFWKKTLDNFDYLKNPKPVQQVVAPIAERKPQLGNPEYSTGHTAPHPEEGAMMHDLHAVFPDIETHGQQYYGTGERYDSESFAPISRVKGRPSASVHIYRAVHKDVENPKINAGDWVTTSPSYAKEHGQANLGNKYKILKKTVRADELATNGDSIHEWGYWPKTEKAGGGTVDRALALTRRFTKDGKAATLALKPKGK